jgi:hypothetical protein
VDAYRLSFPLTLVLLILGGATGIVGTWATLNVRITALEHQVALDAVRIDEMRVIIAEIKGFMNGSGMKEAKRNE